jgi:hypothetical protein
MSTIVHSPKVTDDIHAPRAWARVAGVCWLIAIAGHLRRSSPGLADAIEKQTHAWRSADPESARQPRD